MHAEAIVVLETDIPVEDTSAKLQPVLGRVERQVETSRQGDEYNWGMSAPTSS